VSDEELSIYSIKMSFDDKAATVTLRSDEPFTYRILIHHLRALADQLEGECEEEERSGLDQ
jgi:hypothetical protein